MKERDWNNPSSKQEQEANKVMDTSIEYAEIMNMAELFGVDLMVKKGALKALTDDFKNENPVHNWRNHIHPNLKIQWDKIDVRVRLSSYFIACNAADDEDWN